MALELESEIMREIGLGNHYSWFNGSGSCRGFARAAASKIEPAIEKHHAAGEQIAAPVRALIVLVDDSLRINGSDYSLTKTWQVASDVIRAHIHLAGVDNPHDFASRMERSIRDSYGLNRYSAPSMRHDRWNEK